MVQRVAGLVLAAGAGRRLGRPKALVELDGTVLVQRAADVLSAAGCGPVVAVLGAAADRVVAATTLPEAVVNGRWDEGMGSSLRAGLAALTGRADAAVVLLVDQPAVGHAAVERIVGSWTGAADAVVATYGGRPGHPVLLAADVWDEVAAGAVGDVGARRWLRDHPDRVRRVACDDVADPADIDTPADLAAFTGPDAVGPRAEDAGPPG